MPSDGLPREIPVARRRAPVVAPAVKERARQSLARWVGIAQQRFNAPLFMPSISFDLTGKAAGMAHLDRRHVQLNAILLTENEEAFNTRTIPHELAHLIDWHLHGVSDGHGDKWKAIMRRLGLEPSRTHSYDVTNARTTKHYDGFACACGPHSLSAKMHARFQRGVKYQCKRCKRDIRYVGTGALPPRPAPIRPPPAALQPPSRAPSEAMLRYADSLARKHGIPLPPLVKLEFDRCKAFLDKWSQAVVAPRLPATPAGRPPTGDFPPTERQLSYAQSIATRKKLSLPPDVLRSKQKMSEWIDANR